MINQKIIILIIITAIMNSCANLLIKKASNKFVIPDSIKELLDISIFNMPFIIGISLFAISLLFYAFLLSRVNLNIVYPILTSINFIVVNLGAFALYNEKFTLLHIISLTIILFGIWLLSLSS